MEGLGWTTKSVDFTPRRTLQGVDKKEGQGPRGMSSTVIRPQLKGSPIIGFPVRHRLDIPLWVS